MIIQDAQDGQTQGLILVANNNSSDDKLFQRSFPALDDRDYNALPDSFSSIAKLLSRFQEQRRNP